MDSKKPILQPKKFAKPELKKQTSQVKTFPKADEHIKFTPAAEPMPMGKRPIIEHNPLVFKKTKKEKDMLLTVKKEFAEKHKKKFGTKRPTGRKVFSLIHKSSK